MESHCVYESYLMVAPRPGVGRWLAQNKYNDIFVDFLSHSDFDYLGGNFGLFIIFYLYIMISDYVFL